MFHVVTKSKIGVASNGIIFTPNYVKNDPLIQNFNRMQEHTHTHTHKNNTVIW